MWLPSTSIAIVTVLTAFVRGVSSEAGIKVVNLSVNDRTDTLLDVGDPTPSLGWQFIQQGDCIEKQCPADRQTAYHIQSASTLDNLLNAQLIWDSGKVDSALSGIRFGHALGSRDTVYWRVQVWDANGNPSEWSTPSTFTVGLLDNSDWGEARWIDYPDRTEDQPLPLFVRQFELPAEKHIVKAFLYLSGVGMHLATVNGQQITDEVLAPGYSNYQLSSEYRTYDVIKWLRPGDNAIGVRLGNGPAYVRTNVRNPAVGRNSPYAWWQSQYKGNSSLTREVEAGVTQVALNNVTGYTFGGTINIDVGGGGDDLESRVITAIDNTTNTIQFADALDFAHSQGIKVTGSGNNIAASDPSAGAAVLPRLIGRLEIKYSDGSSTVIVTDRSWLTALGPLVIDIWYSGPDYDARREQTGWDSPGTILDSSDWISAGLAPPPNLATKLVARAAEPVKVQEQFTPVDITNPVRGTWVFDFGQNFAGWPLLRLPEVPAGLIIKVAPGESLNANGTINQASLGPGSRGTDLFYTYTTAGRTGGESWHPEFSYFGMQWVQVTGLPENFTPGPDLITGLRLQANVPPGGTFTSSDARVNRIHKMAHYSFMSNLMSVFTDCPGREKLSYPADYTMAMGAIYRNFNLGAFMRTTMHTLVEGQSIANTSMAGNVALKTPVYDWGYTRQFGDEINWGNGIVLVPSLLYDLYGDTTVMDHNFDRMKFFVDYIMREKARNNIVEGALADWVAADERTSTRITGTWGYYLTINAMARMANATGRIDDALRFTNLATDIRNAFNAAFFNSECTCYTSTGNNSTQNATQAAQAFALDAGLVPEEHREQVLGVLVNMTRSFNASSTRLTGGTLGLGPIVRVLTAGGYDDVLWEALQPNDYPSYGYFLEPTTANPHGFTTIGEEWDRSASKNHMILAQIDEWFYSTIAGIRPAAFSTFTTLWENGLVFEPRVVGDIQSAAGSYMTPWGQARSEWNRTADGIFTLLVTVPPNLSAEVRVFGNNTVHASGRAQVGDSSRGYTSFHVPSGQHLFSTLVSN